jgi:hypothetical protein
MPDINPLAVIAECIEKAKATTDQELISDYIAEALGYRRRCCVASGSAWAGTDAVGGIAVSARPLGLRPKPNALASVDRRSE